MLGGVHCVVMLAGSRPYGRPQGLVQAFSFSHFSSVLVKGFNQPPGNGAGMFEALGLNGCVSRKFGFHLTLPCHKEMVSLCRSIWCRLM